MPIGDTVVDVLLDADLWAARACGLLSRDFTQTEWNLYVPGDLPFRPVCSESTRGPGLAADQLSRPDVLSGTIALDPLLHKKVYRGVMDITLLYFDGCPNWEHAAEHLDALAREFPDVGVTRRLVDTDGEAQRIGFHGSPSILIDGVDVFAPEDAPVGLSCRMYQTPDGFAGSPTIEQLRDAVTMRRPTR